MTVIGRIGPSGAYYGDQGGVPQIPKANKIPPEPEPPPPPPPKRSWYDDYAVRPSKEQSPSPPTVHRSKPLTAAEMLAIMAAQRAAQETTGDTSMIIHVVISINGDIRRAFTSKAEATKLADSIGGRVMSVVLNP